MVALKLTTKLLVVTVEPEPVVEILLEVVISPVEYIFLTVPISVVPNNKPPADVIVPDPVVVILLEVVIAPVELIFLTDTISPVVPNVKLGTVIPVLATDKIAVLLILKI